MADHVDDSYEAPHLVTRSYEKPTLQHLHGNRAEGKPRFENGEQYSYGPS